VDLPSLLVEIIESAAVVRFNRPKQRNSLSVSTLHELDNALGVLLPREDLEGIIFTGTGDVFASGADISELTQLDPSSAVAFSKLGQRVFQRIADAQQLTIAAINGYCMGGALDLALACDIRVASKDAVISHPGAMRGIITGWGGTQRLPRIVGPSKAIQMFITASRINSATALSIGLVSEVGDPVVETALSVFRQTQRP
jgi:enoyl-CoA hydratase